MKILATVSLLAVTALAFAPKPAKAGDEGIAAIGGFIGGLVLGAALDNDHDRYADYDRYGRHDRYDRHGSATVIIGNRHPHRDGGYWKHVTVKSWVPGYWTTSRDRHGHRCRFYVEGRWEYRTDRVWVAYDRYDRHDRRYGYDGGYRR